MEFKELRSPLELSEYIPAVILIKIITLKPVKNHAQIEMKEYQENIFHLSGMDFSSIPLQLNVLPPEN